MRADVARGHDEPDAAEADDLADDPSHTFLTFDLGGQTVGVAVAFVREILDQQPLTRLPGAPGNVEGVIDVRGASVPIFDLSSRLGLGAARPGAEARLIVFERPGGQAFGVRADKVREVFRIEPGTIEPAPDLPGGESADRLLGLCRREGALVALLAAETLFDGTAGPT